MRLARVLPFRRPVAPKRPPKQPAMVMRLRKAA
jgi:hypothetical protein